MKTTGMAD